MAVVQRARAPETETASIGHNRPPVDVEARNAFDAMLDRRDGFRDRIEQLLGAADRAVATDEESAGRCGELVKQIRAAGKVIEDAHKETKEPYLLAGRAVDAAKNEALGPLSVAKSKVEAKQTTFLREQEAIRQTELRRQREAEEARRREEWEAEQKRIRAEREAAAANAEPMEEAAPTPPPAPVFVPEPERQIIRGDYGAAVSGTRVWLSQIEDYGVAFMAVSNNEKVREAIDKAIANQVRGGVREIPGVRIWSDVKASNR